MVGRAWIIAGTGRYEDPWHRYEDCARCLADAIETQGLSTEIRLDPDRALGEVSDDVALLAVLVGEPRDDGSAAPTPDARRGLDGYLDSGRPLLAMHSAASAFPQYARWEEAIGARWVAGQSWHPPIGWGRVSVSGDVTPDGAACGFDVYDEFYAGLRVASDVAPLATHDIDGTRYPLVWRREGGPGRVVYDALGHDPRSYGSAGHARLLANEVAWLMDGLGSG